MKTLDTISARVEQDLQKVYEQYVEEAKEYFNKELKKLFEDFPLLSEVSYIWGSLSIKATRQLYAQAPKTNTWGLLTTIERL